MRALSFAVCFSSLVGCLSLAQAVAAGTLTSPTPLTGAAAGANGAQGTSVSPGCTKPGTPICMNDTTTFISADRMSVCQGEVREYVDRTMAYLQCLSNEHQSISHELSRNVDRFNCRLSGSRTCG